MLSANPTIARLGFLLVASLAASGYTAIVLFSRLARREAGEARLPSSREQAPGEARQIA